MTNNMTNKKPKFNAKEYWRKHQEVLEQHGMNADQFDKLINSYDWSDAFEPTPFQIIDFSKGLK